MRLLWILLVFPCGAFAGEIEIRNEMIKVADGVKLAATFYLPKLEPGKRVPVLFELLPYRKDDEFLARDYSLCEYFARQGFAVARVDVRGTGGSEGRLPGREYSDAEINDAVKLIELLSKMPWSNGNVGMYGISWSGFNAIITAMKKPKALKAILAVDASDDLFHDDVHFIDGVFHLDEYSLDIDHANGLPKSGAYELDESYFRNRFDVEPWIFTYKKNQRDSTFWRSKSARFQKPLEVPAFLIGGLLDGYRDSVPRMLERAKAPVKALLGPWNHSWPDDVDYGPAYEWRAEAVRWWKHWLTGEDTGLLKEPRLTVFVRKSHAPDLKLKESPGSWRLEDWPIKRKQDLTFTLRAGSQMRRGLSLVAGSLLAGPLKYRAGEGAALGYWWGETSPDMAETDKTSLIFDSDPLDKGTEVVGFPALKLRASSTAPLAHWVARLEDVAPDGKVTFVTGGAMNGSQRASRAAPKALVPGELADFSFPLHFTTWVFPAGHRIRLALSNAAFPMLWPTPFAMDSSVQVHDARSALTLPVIPPAQRPVPALIPVEPRRNAAGTGSEGEEWPLFPEMKRVGNMVHALGKGAESSTFGPWKSEKLTSTDYWVNEEDPAKAGFIGTMSTEMKADGRGFRLSSRLEVESDAREFRIHFKRQLFTGENPVRERTWEKRIPRDFQ